MNTGENKKIFQIIEKKRKKEKIVALTAYDFPQAQLVDQSGVDIILVGDSLGNVVLGKKDTTRVTMDEMVHHLIAVHRAKPQSLLVADMPSGSYETVHDTLRNAKHLMELGAEAVKLEGGVEIRDQLKALQDDRIPVMGHIGLLPQTAWKDGGFKMKGKSEGEISKIQGDLRVLEDIQAFAVVLELVKHSVAEEISQSTDIATIGIGAGKGCDGQILVLHDLLALSPGPIPRHVQPQVNYFGLMKGTIQDWMESVKNSDQ